MSGEDLRAIMSVREERFGAELRDQRLDEVSLARVLGRSRRAHRVRGATTWLGAAAAATVVSVGVWAVMAQQVRDPLVAPPSITGVTESAAPTPTPAPTDSGATEPEITFSPPLPADGFFLDSRQLTQDVWLAADDGWSLTYWQPSRQALGEAGHDVTDPARAAVYLMDDQGNRYEVSHFDVPEGAVVELLAWEPTDFEATVVYRTGDRIVWGFDKPALGLLDIRTGHIQPVQGAPASTWFLGVNTVGNLLFQTGTTGDDIVVTTRALQVVGTFQGSGHSRLSPDGTTLVGWAGDSGERPQSMTTRSATTGELLWSRDVSAANVGAECHASGWATQNTPALVCMERGADSGAADYTVNLTKFYGVDESGVTLVVQQNADLYWGGPTPLREGLVAGGGETFDGNDGYLLYNIGGASLVPWPGYEGAVIGYSLSEAGDVTALREWAYAEFPSVAAINNATGNTFMITPRQQDDPEWWWTTSSGVVFVGAVGSTY